MTERDYGEPWWTTGMRQRARHRKNRERAFRWVTDLGVVLLILAVLSFAAGWNQ